jgi:hypothetical protein
VWDDYEKRQKNQAKMTLDDKKFITRAIQKIDPFTLSRKVLIEVWHERSKVEKEDKFKEGVSGRPDAAEFMGEAFLDLDLMEEIPPTTLELKLQSNPDLSSRDVCGTITIVYEYKPADEDDDDDGLEKRISAVSTTTSCKVFPNFTGELKVLILRAEGLTNCCWSVDANRRSRAWEPTANPYVILYCYPNSPERKGGVLRPAAWRSPTVMNSLSPTWNQGASFNYRWRRPIEVKPPEASRESASPNPLKLQDASLGVSQDAGQSPPSSMSASDLKDADLKTVDDPAKIMALLQHMGREMGILQNQVQTLAARLDPSAGKKALRPKREGSASRRNKDSQNHPHLRVLQLNAEEPNGTAPFQLPYSMEFMKHDKLAVAFARPNPPESESSTETC